MTDAFKVVLIANDDHPIPDWVSGTFADAGVDYSYHQCYDQEDLQRWAANADVLWLQSAREDLVVEEYMDIFKRAGAVIKCGSGTDNIDHEACTKRGIIVAHTPEDVTDPTSDHHIALLFSAVRQTVRQDRLVRQGKWDPAAVSPLGPLAGADLGLVGFGRIGRAVVRKLSGFEMVVRVYDPYVDETAIEAAGADKVDLAGLLESSQYVLLACPLTAETRQLIGEEELRMMRSDAVLVNVARAGVVDEQALIMALREQWISAAALDVVEEHPLGLRDEFRNLENCIVTPHMGGARHDYPDAIFSTVVEVIIEMSRKHMPKWIVNRDVIPKWDLV